MDYINKLLTNAEILIAFSALVTSIVSILYTAKSVRIQREHNYKSVKPVASIDIGDYENDIYVRISNNGVGPLIIKDVQVTNGSDSDSKQNLIHILPKDLQLGILWTTFSTKVISQSIKVDHHLDLIQKKFTGNKTISPEWNKQRQELRKVLKTIRIKIVYTDIYGTAEYIEEETLERFGNRLDKDEPMSEFL